MVIYIDVLFCLNLFVTYFLLLSTCAVNKIKCSFLRLLFGSLMGALVSLAIFLPPLHFLLDLTLKLIYSLLIVLVSFSFKATRRFLRIAATFLAVSFAYAGIMIAIWFIFKPSGMAINNSFVYFNISPLLLIFSTLASYVVIRIVSFLSSRSSSHHNIYTLDISLENKTVSCDALMDTGNNLHDLFTGDSVIIAQYDLIEALLPSSARHAFATGVASAPDCLSERYRIIPYSAIGTKGFLPAFKPDYVEIRQKDKCCRTQKVTVAVSSNALTSEYKALIGRDLTEDLH